MSEPSPSAPGKAGPPKQPVSPARNVISLVVLLAVVVVGYFEVSAKYGYNAAAKALEKRLADEDHGLPPQEEAEKLIGKPADGPGSDVQDGAGKLTMKTYTWKGLIGSYTLAAYYTTSGQPALHHYEAGEKVQHEEEPAPPVATKSEPAKKGRGPQGRGRPAGKAEGKSEAHEKAAPEPKPDEKPKADAEKVMPPPAPPTTAPADEKTAPEPKPEEKAKAAADEKNKPD